MAPLSSLIKGELAWLTVPRADQTADSWRAQAGLACPRNSLLNYTPTRARCCTKTGLPKVTSATQRHATNEGAQARTQLCAAAPPAAAHARDPARVACAWQRTRSHPRPPLAMALLLLRPALHKPCACVCMRSA
jgi:hypothetical protein